MPQAIVRDAVQVRIGAALVFFCAYSRHSAQVI
jgi:hypothetical protein